MLDFIKKLFPKTLMQMPSQHAPETESALSIEEHEHLLRLILENANDLVAIVDFDGRRLYNNNSYQPILGNPTDLKGTNSFTEIHPDDREKIKRVFAETVRTRRGQKAIYRFIGKNGAVRHIESQGHVIPPRDGRPGKIIIISRDVTEYKAAEEGLKQNERRFHALVENISDAVTLLDHSGTILYASPAAQQLLTGSHASPSFVPTEKQVIFDIIHPDDSELAQTILARVLAHPGEHATEQLRVLRRDGSTGWVEGAFTNLLNDPYVQAVVATFRDVTDRKQLEEDLRQIQKMESIGMLAGGIAHDFNNLLAVMLGYSAAIARAKHDPNKIVEHVDVLQKAAKRGASLVRQLLMFARKSETFFESVNTNDVILDVMQMLGETFPKTIRFSMNLEPELPHLHADAGQLHQMIVNLCMNARDAILETPKGRAEGGELSITTDLVTGEKLRTRFAAAAEEHYVRIRIADTGAGMNDITRARMFEPFFTTKANGKGTGLGLSVVFGILQNHHGFIDVGSAPNKGTTFYLYFPASTQFTSSVPGEDEVRDDALYGSETILVVEDEPVLRKLLTSLLEAYGYSVIAAGDGVEAVSQFELNRNDIDLVVSDLGLPGMNGYESLQRLREIKRNVPFVMVSGFFDPEMQDAAARAGVRAFIQKPFVPEKILATIREVLHHHSPVQELVA